MFRSFMIHRGGNFAIVSALAMLPMILAVGFGIDASRYYKARSHLQEAVDMAALAVAASPEQDSAKLRALTQSFILTNVDPKTVQDISISEFEATPNDIKVDVTGSIRSTIMRLAKFDLLPVATFTAAKRAPDRYIEIALVLDNTYSMSAKDPVTGEARIATLRKAGKSLVETLLPVSDEGTVSIALVPYADHVNVGTANKTAFWLALNGAERDVPSTRVCGPKYKTGKKVTSCKRWSTIKCTIVKDGISEPSTCNDQCLESVIVDEEKQDCTGQNAQSFRFYGCVGTRTTGSLRLSDTLPMSKYPGYVETTQRCARPIIALTKDRESLLAGVAAMTHQPSNYVAYTHIPSGVVWGLNVLSPLPPFDEAQPYGEDGSPRKIMILMTDGDNTLIHENSTGKHVGFDSKKESAQFAAVNSDTLDICVNAKSKKIEIYTIAFGVTKQEAKDLLKNCATDQAHYFDATDASKLTDAFSGIAREISQVRLAK